MLCPVKSYYIKGDTTVPGPRAECPPCLLAAIGAEATGAIVGMVLEPLSAVGAVGTMRAIGAIGAIGASEALITIGAT